MRAEFTPSLARGSVAAPPSKSMAHRLLLCAGLSGEKCRVEGISESQDMLATLDCLAAMGVQYEREGDTVSFFGGALNFAPEGIVSCRESGSTLRFFVPLFLLGEREVTLTGHGRLMERPMTLYAELCAQRGLFFEQNGALLRLRGPLKSGTFRLRGDVSSQFVTGLLYALPLLSGESRIELIPPVESRPYIEMTRRAQSVFGVESRWEGENTLVIAGNQRYCAADCAVEGDWSNAAFLDGFSLLGGEVAVTGLDGASLQGDKIYREYYAAMEGGCPTLDISQCPDLGPVLMALAAARNGAHLRGTKRLRIKESDRGAAMAEELSKLGVSCRVEEDDIFVPAGQMKAPAQPLYGHNDHRVVMALSLLLSRLGGSIEGAQAVSKSFPNFFGAIKSLGIEVKCYED